LGFLACGVSLVLSRSPYEQRGCLLPELRMLQCGEIPRHTRVVVLAAGETHEGVVLNYMCGCSILLTGLAATD
jgi:hypothetical protein